MKESNEADDFFEEDVWPQQGARLFVPGGDYFDFAHYGWGHVSNHFHNYISGYKNSADLLITEALRSHDIAEIDTSVYPILFLYRQFVELSLKWIYIQYSGETHEQQKVTIDKSGHNLLAIWKRVEEILLERANEKESSDVEIVRDYISQFDQFDRSSLEFRYPVTKSLEPIRNSEATLNLRNLKLRMAELDIFFAGSESQLSYQEEFREDMREYSVA